MDIRPRRLDPGFPRLRVERYGRRSRKKKLLIAILALGIVGSLLAGAAVATNTLGAGDLYHRAIAKIDRFLAGPPPDRQVDPDVLVTPAPPSPSPSPTPSPAPSPTPTSPAPVGGTPHFGTPFAVEPWDPQAPKIVRAAHCASYP